jgi:preprotein translocase subunit SecY
MNPADVVHARERICMLWTCVALFLLRVLGQIEALLVQPDWLPPMAAWHSGYLPYYILLPAQIVLLMVMAVLAAAETRPSWSPPKPWRRWVRVFAIVYFLAMGARLIVQYARGVPDIISAGGIPVVFHWVLALFLYTLGRPAKAPAWHRSALYRRHNLQKIV